MALIIKSLKVDPPNYDELSDDEDDFVKDPAQYRDSLPQPYRYIDGLLSEFIDDVWDAITALENERLAERAKVRPPKYQCAIQLQVIPTTKALVESADGRFVFAACPGGLSILDAAKRSLLHTYEDEQMDICSMKCTMLGAEIYMLSCIDELGMCRVFGSACEKVFAIKVLNEESTHSKYQVVKCDASEDGDYIGLVVEDPSSSDTLLEVYQIPRDAWAKEIEDIKPKLLQEDKSPAHEPTVTEEKGEAEGEAEGGEDPQLSARRSNESQGKTAALSQRPKGSKRVPSTFKSPVRKISKERRVKSKDTGESTIKITSAKTRPSTRAESRASEKSSSRSNRRRKAGSRRGQPIYKFSPSTIVMKLRPPEGLSANTGTAPAATLTHAADGNLILGSGQGHLLTKPYLEVRQEAFNDMHSDLIAYKTNQEGATDSHPECHFHFFSPGLPIPYGIEQPGAMKKPSSVGVWWGGRRQFTFYCLTKQVKVKKTQDVNPDAAVRKGKVTLVLPTVPGGSRMGQPEPPISTPRNQELERPAETIWPQAAIITASATSPDSALVAIGLENGIVSVWDKHLGLQRKSVTIGSSPIVKLDFMDPSICLQSNNLQACYPTSTSCYVLVRCEDSSTHLLNCGMLDFSPPIQIIEPAAEDNDIVSQLVMCHYRIPEIILRVHKDGTMYLQDVNSNKILCQVSLPATHVLATPWSPIASFGAHGQMLYIKGAQNSPDNVYVEDCNESVFVFQLRSFPTLDAYVVRSRLTVPYISPSSVDTRVNALLKQRVKASGPRQQRLQQRWPLMKQELLRVSHIKSH